MALLFTEIDVTLRYEINGSDFLHEDDNIQFQVIPTLVSDIIFIPNTTSLLSISIDVDGETCFLSISLRYWCSDNTLNGNMVSKSRNCLNDTEYLESTWNINCLIGGFVFEFVSDKTILYALQFSTTSKYS